MRQTNLFEFLDDIVEATRQELYKATGSSDTAETDFEGATESKLVLDAGTTVKVNGIPFALAQDTIVSGLQTNLDLAKGLM